MQSSTIKYWCFSLPQRQTLGVFPSRCVSIYLQCLDQAISKEAALLHLLQCQKCQSSPFKRPTTMAHPKPKLPPSLFFGYCKRWTKLRVLQWYQLNGNWLLNHLLKTKPQFTVASTRTVTWVGRAPPLTVTNCKYLVSREGWLSSNSVKKILISCIFRAPMFILITVPLWLKRCSSNP